MRDLEELVKNLNNDEVEHYCLCNPDKKENTYKQLRDFDYINSVFKDGKVDLYSPQFYRNLVNKDIEKKMKECGSTKVTSRSFKEKYWDRYHYIKHENCHVMYTIYGKQGQYSITFLQRVPTSRGSLYVIAISEYEAILIHHHVLERYEERAGVASNDRLEAIKWILKEFNHTSNIINDREYKKGFLFKDVFSVIASGMMLGNVMRGFMFFKTYIPMDMLDEVQDSMHEKAWMSIEQERSKQKRNAPVI